MYRRVDRVHDAERIQRLEKVDRMDRVDSMPHVQGGDLKPNSCMQAGKTVTASPNMFMVTNACAGIGHIM